MMTCRFAAWITLVNKGIFHLVFLVDAHCSVGDAQQFSRYAKATESGHSRVYGAPTTARASRNILYDNDTRLEAPRIRSGGILAYPTRRQKTRDTHTLPSRPGYETRHTFARVKVMGRSMR